MKTKKLSALILSIAISLCCLPCLTACNSIDGETKTRTVVDMAGRTVELPEKINKYIDVWYSHQAVVAMLDKCEHMAATPYSKDDEINYWFFEMYPDITAASDIDENMSAEAFLSLGADLLFYAGPGENDLADNLALAGVPSVNIQFNNFEEMKKSITLIAEVLNTDYAKQTAQKYNAYLDKTIKDVSAKTSEIAEDDKVTLLSLANFDNMMADGANTLRNNWIEISGAKSLAASVGSGQVYINVEQVFQWDPDFIFSRSRGDAAWAYSVDDFKPLKSIQNHHVYSNPFGVFIWDGCSTEVALQIKWASSIFYPNLFEDVDIKAEIKTFYSDFYGYNISDKNVDNLLNLEPPEGK